MPPSPTWTRRARVETVCTPQGWIAHDPATGRYAFGDIVVESAWDALGRPRELADLASLLEHCDDPEREAARVLTSLHALGLVEGPSPGSLPSPRLRALAPRAAVALMQAALLSMPTVAMATSGGYAGPPVDR